MEGIGKNVEYISKIVQDLQDFARRILPVAKETDIEALCQEVVFKNGGPPKIEAACKIGKEVKKNQRGFGSSSTDSK